MSSTTETYTYRCGKKVKLEKNPHQFVVRALPEKLREMGWSEVEQVSSASTRITALPSEIETAMSTSRGVAPTHHAYQFKETGEEFLITDRIFVRFKKKPSNTVLNEFIAKYSLVLITKYSPKEFLFQLSDHTGMNPLKLVVMLTEKDSLIESAGHDLNRRFDKYQPPVPSDPEYLKQWHLHDRLNHAEFDPRATTRCEEAWNLLGNYGSEDAVVAVSDDGCRLDHADFDSPDKFSAWGYFRGQRLINNSDFDAVGESMYDSGSNHGTSCAGVIAGEVDALKTVGATPACQLLPIKWESSGPSLFISDSKLITALDFIDDKADILSNSWGSSPISTWEIEVLNKIRALSISGGRRGKGIVFLWAAGNENCPIQHVSNIDIPYTDGVELGSNGNLIWVGVQTSRIFEHNLVDIPGVMHIAALASPAQRSHYSNYGTGIGLCAPTNNVHTYRRLVIDGLGITTTTGQGSGVTDFFGGTSSATPLVAGIAALVISANPELEAKDVISILKSTASKDLKFDEYPKTPPASYDPDTSWDVSPAAPFDNGAFTDMGFPEGTWSPWFGHGKIDALEAVKEALARRAVPSENTFQGSSTPSLAIPDVDANGVSDSINCPENGTLSAIKISVDITHTYIGDLIISITSPSGTEAVLQSRNGGSTDNLSKTFDLSNATFLNTLIGEQVHGDWLLSVKDMAAIDTGTLNGWNIELDMANATEVMVEESPGTRIPDNLPEGIERTLNVTKSGRINSIEVSLDITHTYVGDLSVELVSPNSGGYILHSRSGGSSDNIIRSYTIADTPVLSALQGKSIKGNWKLKIIDRANLDIGKLNHWKIKFTLQ